jgi:biotin carboxyl carrier protein
MSVEIQLGGEKQQKITVELRRDSNRWLARIDGRETLADVAEISPNVFSVLCHGKSFEVWVTPAVDGTLKLQVRSHEFTAEVIDPRAWSGRRHGHVEAEGRQQIVAPMPGKVVRVLVEAGDQVEMGQGLLVVEAMKMQNEIRSPKSGKIERVLAKAGQPVNAGEVLAWIE